MPDFLLENSMELPVLSLPFVNSLENGRPQSSAMLPSHACLRRTIDVSIGSTDLSLPQARNMNVEDGANFGFYPHLFICSMV